jgi:hypothetical protein
LDADLGKGPHVRLKPPLFFFFPLDTQRRTCNLNGRRAPTTCASLCVQGEEKE